MDLQDWSTTAGSNTDIDGVDIGEGCEPANINNAIRLAMANVAAFRNLTGGAATTTGSGNAYALTSGLGLAAYAQGLLLGFEANHTNSGAATLNVDGLGARNLRRSDGSALVAGDIVAGGIYLAAYEAGANAILVLNPSAPGVTASSTTTFTNKTIDGDLNTLQDIATGALKTRTGSDAAVVTGTAGANGRLAAWDANGDVIDANATVASVPSALLTTRGQIIRRGASAPEALALGTTGHVVRSDGTDTVTGTLVAGSFATAPGIVTPAMLDNGTALSVLGVTGNSGAARADIAAGSDHQVLRRSGTALAFGAVNLAQAAAVTGVLPAANLPDATTSAEGVMELATAAEFMNDTQGAYALTPQYIWDASASVALTDAATITVDMATFLDAHVVLGGNRTLGAPSNAKPGQKGVIKATASGAIRTLARNAVWKSDANITWPVSIASGAAAYFGYHVDDSSNIIITGVVNGPT